MQEDPHELAERTSLALHRVVGDRLRADAALLERARERVAGWRRTGSVAACYADEWQRLLDAGLDAVCAVLEEPDEERCRDLRRVSPFAGVLSSAERWRIWRRVHGRPRVGR